MPLDRVPWFAAVVGLELVLLIALAGAIYLLSTFLVRRTTPGGALSGLGRAMQLRIRNLLLALTFLSALAIVGYNGWLAMNQVDVWAHTRDVIAAFSVDTWRRLGSTIGIVAATALVLVVVLHGARRALQVLEASLGKWQALREQDERLSVLFRGFERVIVNVGWMLLALLAVRLLAAPAPVVDGLFLIVASYLVIAVGLLIVRSSVLIVDAVDRFAHRYAQHRGWLRYYDDLRPVVPSFRVSLEYSLWIAIASLLLLQLGLVPDLVAWGPRLVQAIATFFVGRVIVELGRLEIQRRMLPPEGLDETARRRRATIAPLVRSTFTYAAYFTTAVLILGLLGFNPLPFLAGAGILGLVIGFGAQSLINDVVSGFFILFENTYLAGDSVEAAGAKGVVEAIEFRTTKIRDSDGRLHIVRNGDVKQVINYSKDYTMAIVLLEVSYDADLRLVFAILREAGRRVRAENPDVVADTHIDGITAFGASTMTVRTSTRVRAGRHDSAAAAIRLAFKEAFDRQAPGLPRKTLVPENLAGASTG